MSAGSWEQARSELAAGLWRLEDGDVIILRSGRRYTQLMRQGVGICVEAASNGVLPPDQQLGAEQEAQLLAQGWQPPAAPLRENWWYDGDSWPLSTLDSAKVADMMVLTLRDVYGVSGPADIEELSFNAFE